MSAAQMAKSAVAADNIGGYELMEQERRTEIMTIWRRKEPLTLVSD